MAEEAKESEPTLETAMFDLARYHKRREAPCEKMRLRASKTDVEPGWGPNGGSLEPIKKMRARHRSMARDVAAGGLTNVEIGKLYSMSKTQVSRIICSPVFIAEVARIETDLEGKAVEVRAEIRAIAPAARMVLAKTIAKEPDELTEDLSARKFQANVAQDLLDRAGVVKPNTDAGLGGLHLHLSKTEEKHIHLMSDKDLREDLFDLLKEGE